MKNACEYYNVIGIIDQMATMLSLAAITLFLMLPGKMQASLSYESSTACNYGNTTHIASFFHSSFMDNTSCPTDIWMKVLGSRLRGIYAQEDISIRRKSIMSKKKLVFFNVGFNKGLNYALWSSVFYPELSVHLVDWMAIFNISLGNEADCGCRGCGLFDIPRSGYITSPRLPFVTSAHQSGRDEAALLSPLKLRGRRGAGPSKRIRFIGIDINKQNIDLSHNISAFISARNEVWREYVSLELYQAAVTSVDGGHVWAPRWACGDSANFKYFETCYLVSRRWWPKSGDTKHWNRFKQRNFAIESVSLDSFVPRLQGGAEMIIDVLLIDTEGSDAHVLFGSRSLFSQRRIRLLIFEYHGSCPWPDTQLKDVVAMLWGYDYECFYDGDSGLWPISDSCWHPWYEVWMYSNIVCVLRVDVWRGAIAPYIITEEKVNRLRNADSPIEYYFNYTLPHQGSCSTADKAQ